MNTASTAILAALIAGGTVAALAVADPWPATFSGYATAIDADTLRVGGVRVRLAGIDAPEAGQTCQRALSCWPCGPEATRLMLITLVTRRGGLVLDCFAGSGTAGVAALATGRDAILIERDDTYIKDIRARMAFYEGGGGHSVAAKARSAVPRGTAPLFDDL